MLFCIQKQTRLSYGKTRYSPLTKWRFRQTGSPLISCSATMNYKIILQGPSPMRRGAWGWQSRSRNIGWNQSSLHYFIHTKNDILIMSEGESVWLTKIFYFNHQIKNRPRRWRAEGGSGEIIPMKICFPLQEALYHIRFGFAHPILPKERWYNAKSKPGWISDKTFR